MKYVRSIIHIAEGAAFHPIGSGDHRNTLTGRSGGKCDFRPIKKAEGIPPDAGTNKACYETRHAVGGVIVHEDRFTGKHVRRHGRKSCQRMKRRDSETGGITEKREGIKLLAVDQFRTFDKCRVKNALLHIIGKLPKLLLNDCDLDLRMLLGKSPDKLQNSGPAQRPVIPDRQMRPSVGAGARIFQYPAVAFQNTGKAGLHDLARLRQINAVSVSRKERNLHFLLQLPDLKGHGRLRDIHPFRGLCHIPDLGGSQKTFNAKKVHAADRPFVMVKKS